MSINPSAMFNTKKTEESKALPAATIIATGTILNGNLNSENDLRIDGKVLGNVYCSHKVIVGAMGLVQGNIEAQHADVLGTLLGNVVATDSIVLRGRAVVNGDLHTNSLQIEAEVRFNGNCHMGGSSQIEIESTIRLPNGQPAAELALAN
ncbi:MAG: polymer-forming cytoskeletal protein [Bacteroidetes bacterium]|nr:MAG: polymer-forming cytoskeletal protein [Bacteroidota bacterium]